MTKYKIGDRVQVMKGVGRFEDSVLGRVGTVARVFEINGVECYRVLLDGFNNPHANGPTVTFYSNQLASWLNDSKETKKRALDRYLRYKKNNEYKNEMARYCRKNIIGILDDCTTHRTVQTVIPKIKNVIYSDPATIVFWEDGTKTVVKCKNEKFDPEKGLAMAFSKKILGNKGNYYNVFKKWLPEEKPRNATIPICHEIQNRVELMCRGCVHKMKFEDGYKCTCSWRCINGDEWSPKK